MGYGNIIWLKFSAEKFKAQGFIDTAVATHTYCYFNLKVVASFWLIAA